VQTQLPGHSPRRQTAGDHPVYRLAFERLRKHPAHRTHQTLLSKRLIAITGKHLKGGQVEIVAARRREAAHGPIAHRLWRYIEEEAPGFAAGAN
jgi:hypothetical protein